MLEMCSIFFYCFMIVWPWPFGLFHRLVTTASDAVRHGQLFVPETNTVSQSVASISFGVLVTNFGGRVT